MFYVHDKAANKSFSIVLFINMQIIKFAKNFHKCLKLSKKRFSAGGHFSDPHNEHSFVLSVAFLSFFHKLHFSIITAKKTENDIPSIDYTTKGTLCN